MEVDDAVTTEQNISKLKAELTKGKWNSKTVLELLKVTFVERRKAMLKNDARIRVRKALDEYRCLSHQVEVCHCSFYLSGNLKKKTGIGFICHSCTSLCVQPQIM